MDEGNGRLTQEQRAELQRRGEERAETRGRHQAVVRIDVYENGEAVPRVQYPHGSSIDLTDRAQVNGELVIRTDAGDIFDTVADERNSYDPRQRSTAEGCSPIGRPGSVRASAARS